MPPRAHRSVLSPDRRAWLITLVMLTAGVGSIAWLLSLTFPPPPTHPALIVLFLLLFLGADITFMHVTVGRHNLSVTPAEIPLILALFYLPPLWVLAARLGASVLAHIFRLPAVKVLFNVGVRGLSTAVVCLVLLSLTPLTAEALDVPATWLALLAATGLGNVIANIAVAVVITAAQGWPGMMPLARTMTGSVVVGVFNSIIGLLVLLVLQFSLWAIVPMAFLVLALGVAYRGYAQFRRQHRMLSELYELTQAIGTTRQAGVLADVLLGRIREMLGSESATMWLPAQGRHPEVLLTARVDDAGLIDQPSTPDALRERATRDGGTVAVGPKLGDSTLRDLIKGSGVKDAIVVPLRSGTAVIGCLEVANRLGDLARFGAEDVQLMETLAAHASVAVENARLVDRLRFDAYHDALTGLPNRRRLLAALEEAVKIRAPGEVVAVLLFDVDAMRDVNDSLGHVAGDKLLAEVARRLTALAPAAALIARVGGDEFAVVLRTANADAAVALATELRLGLQAPFPLGTLTLDVDTAAGIALHPEHGTEPETLLQRADLATYAAKSISTAVQLFHLGLESRSVRRLGLAGDLRRALDNNELEVYFQPKVALADRQLVGVECLARWEHPAYGSVAPEDFINVAEHTGQLGRLTEAVLREALRRCRQWGDEGRPLSMAVNLSPRTLVDPDFPTQVEHLLAEYGVPAERLTLEITENGMLGEMDRPLPTLRRLSDIGVRLSVDDFGTGYSSLSYLRRLPVHEVKVDRTFVQGMATDPGDLAIVRAVVDLSRHFGFTVVAEGVESELTLSLLEDMGCDIGQGFFFSRPLPYERLEAWFVAQTEAESTPAGEVRRLRAVP